MSAIVDPSFVADTHPACEDIEKLRLLPFFNSKSTTDSLKRELPTYTAVVKDVFSQTDKTDWWTKSSGPPQMVECMQESTLVSNIISCIGEYSLFYQIHSKIGKNSP